MRQEWVCRYDNKAFLLSHNSFDLLPALLLACSRALLLPLVLPLSASTKYYLGRYDDKFNPVLRLVRLPPWWWWCCDGKVGVRGAALYPGHFPAQQNPRAAALPCSSSAASPATKARSKHVHRGVLRSLQSKSSAATKANNDSVECAVTRRLTTARVPLLYLLLPLTAAPL